MHDEIIVRGARLHNLKNVTVAIPKNRLVVLTGLSGSGKSTLAFDTLHKEGQRQYMESLGFVAFGLRRPPIDSISGLSPTISVDQHLVYRSPRSTVGTATEVYTYLRVLYARVGHRSCPACGEDVPPPYAVSELADDLSENGMDEGDDGEPVDLADEVYPCPHCGASMPQLGMAHFSFNKPAGACPVCTGLGRVSRANLGRLIDPARSVSGGGVLTWEPSLVQHYGWVLQNAGRHYGFAFDLDLAIGQLGEVQRDLLLYGVRGPEFQRHFPDAPLPKSIAEGNFEGVIANLLRRYDEHADNVDYRAGIEKLLIQQTCPECLGDRLRPESRGVMVGGLSIIQAARLPLTGLAAWLADLPGGLSQDEARIAGPILDDLAERIRRLVDVGVGYLTLERSSPTLSAGESQRLRLAALLGSGLTGVLYVLDEPTIGLHARDVRRLMAVLQQLRDLGNTVLVIEHDLEVIRAADHVIDMGPGAGDAGGRVVAAGPPESLVDCADSLTGQYLSGRLSVPIPAQRRVSSGKRLVVRGAREHNLKGVDATFPLGLLIAVTGVSGSGKSSLMLDIVDRAARQRFYGAGEAPGEHAGIEGWEHLDRVVTIDQAAIGRSPRSNAATYTDAWTPIRRAFATVEGARAGGLSARHFSFNVPGGRCERCKGAGSLPIKMHFLPETLIRCPACRGRRFQREVLAVRFRGHSIADVLDMTIQEALLLFADVPAAASRLSLMVDVGMGYLRLGQPATTLSGGEAQRVKLAKELGRRTRGRVLYLLDEPTTGLHVADVVQLLALLQRLVDAGNTVVVIEHNLDVIAAADWVIDLGPEGGEAGGRIVAQGRPREVAAVEESHTGAALRALLM